MGGAVGTGLRPGFSKRIVHRPQFHIRTEKCTMRVLGFTLMMAATITLGGAVSAGKKTPTNKERIIGTWKATGTDRKDEIEFGDFTFKHDGKFTLERDHLLGLAKGTYEVDGDALKITVTYGADGSRLNKGLFPAKLKSISEKEIVLEFNDDGKTAIFHLARVPVPEGAWQAVEEDRKKLQGSWEYVRTEKDGKFVKDE